MEVLVKKSLVEVVNVLENIESQYSPELFDGVIAGAYVLWLGTQQKAVDIENLSEFLDVHEPDEYIRMFLFNKLMTHWTEYRRYITAFSSEQLESLILTYKPEGMRKIGFIETAPEKLYELIIALLNIKDHDFVADMGVGVGDFLRQVHLEHPHAQLWGNELATTAAAIASIRSKFYNGKLTIVQEDMFSSTHNNLIFDKVFCFPTWGMRLGNMPNARKFLATQSPSLPVLKGTGACEWIFALRMLASLKKDGKAALLMTNGGTFNLLDVPIRKYFVERGMIEAVVALPGRIMEHTKLQSSIIVFSNGNTHVRMVDATQLGNKERRGIVLTDSDITQIMNAIYGRDSKIGKRVNCEEILANDSVLNPGRYIQENLELKHGVTFGSVITSIVRAASLSAEELDRLSSKEPTAFQYLMLSNIQNGLIDEELQYLKEFDKRWERFCLQPKDLVISKIGYPFKVAIAPASNHTIIANGNLFIIRVNENVADPYYVKAFLESETGIAILKSVAGGTAMPNFSAEAIKNMPIDLPPIEKQKAIAARYKAKLTEILLLKRKLAQAIDSLGRIVDDTQE